MFTARGGASVLDRAKKAPAAIANVLGIDFRGHDLRRTAATNMAASGVSRDHIARVLNWVYATVLVSSVFFIGVAGVGFAGIGPCGADNPIALVVSTIISAAVLFSAFSLLTERQRRFRGRTVPFYLIVLIAVLFIAFQTLFIL